MIGGVQVLLSGGAGDIGNTPLDIGQLRHLDEAVSRHASVLPPAVSASARSDSGAQGRFRAVRRCADCPKPHRRASGGSPRQGEIHRVQTEGLCDGCISLSNGEAFVVAFAPLTPF